MAQEQVCLHKADFERLVDRLVSYIKEKHSIEKNKWITGDEAMKILNVSSRTTLQNLRDTGKIRFSQPMHKIVLYDRDSIFAYIESHAQDTF